MVNTPSWKYEKIKCFEWTSKENGEIPVRKCMNFCQKISNFFSACENSCQKTLIFIRKCLLRIELMWNQCIFGWKFLSEHKFCQRMNYPDKKFFAGKFSQNFCKFSNFQTRFRFLTKISIMTILIHKKVRHCTYFQKICNVSTEILSQ